MKAYEADEKLDQIAKLASEIEHDKELMDEDDRYSITASWINTDITECDAQ